MFSKATMNQERHVRCTATAKFRKQLSRSHIPAAKSKSMINECEEHKVTSVKKQSVVVTFNTANSYHR